MIPRSFDPVLSAALRNELEALAGRQGDAPAPVRLPPLRRPQVWVTVVTALALVAATLGVLHLTRPAAQPAAPSPRVIDPLTRVQDPASASYVARAVRTLLDAHGTGSGTRTLDVPAGVPMVRTYLNCSSSRTFAIRIDGRRSMEGGCDTDSGNSFGNPLGTGRHTFSVRVPARVAWSLLVIAEPAPTVSAGPLVDPLTQVRDRRVPDALTGDTRPLLQLRGRGSSAPRRVAVPSGVGRVRVLLACRPSSASTVARIDGHLVSGCMNSIAHWFDLTPSSGSVPVQVEAPASQEWALLVVPAPPGATDSPASTLLPYPAVGRGERVLARTRGAGAPATGRYVRTGSGVTVRTTCRGTGWLEVTTGDGGTGSRGSACGAEPATTVLGGPAGEGRGVSKPWSVIPHGDVSWTFTVTDGP